MSYVRDLSTCSRGTYRVCSNKITVNLLFWVSNLHGLFFPHFCQDESTRLICTNKTGGQHERMELDDVKLDVDDATPKYPVRIKSVPRLESSSRACIPRKRRLPPPPQDLFVQRSHGAPTPPQNIQVVINPFSGNQKGAFIMEDNKFDSIDNNMLSCSEKSVAKTSQASL